MQVTISIDIGGTSTKFAIVDEMYRVIDKNTLDTKFYSNELDYIEALFVIIEGLLNRCSSFERVAGIGIGAPSCQPQKGTINGAANLPFSGKVEIVKLLEERFNLPVFLIKDGNAAALGEGALGAAKGMNNYVMLTLGTGLGCGIVVNQKIVAGNNGQAGEWGHSTFEKNGRSCNCGRKGCLETYISATGIKRTIFQLLADSNLDSPLRAISFNDLTSKDIFKAAQKGDALAVQAFEYTGTILGQKLAELTALFEPEAIVLAGGLAEAGTVLLRPTLEAMKKNMLDVYKIKVLSSSLKTNEAALIGAASLVWHNLKLEALCQSL